MITFTDLVSSLRNLCLDSHLTQIDPYENIPIGAATLHPENVYNCLNLEPKPIFFVQPCTRPEDANGLSEPDRLYIHHQFQIIVPSRSKSDIYEKYKSKFLEGKNVTQSQDNWRNPSIGAFGYGYETLLNGREISQTTYITKMLDTHLTDEVCEIAIGLERLLLELNSVEHISKLYWTDGVSYLEKWGAREAEGLKLVKSDATFCNDTAKLMAFFKGSSNIPCSYEELLEISHLYNMTDTTSSMSARENKDIITRMTLKANQLGSKYIKVDKK